jgi:NAD(P)-dependent dehydrogenase (short-subunit alcohol dehydrogenase family)
MGAAKGLTALVTGASRGIGAALAHRLAAEGAEVAVVARSLEAHPHLPGTLRKTVEGIRGLGGRAVAIQGDLSDTNARRRIADEALGKLGHVDILVNNAAAAYYMPFESYSEKRFRIALELNVHAPFGLAQQILPQMRRRRRGWILNISSATATPPPGPPFDEFATSGGALLYGLTKAALDRFSVGLAAEVYADGIAVNSLSPVAAVKTEGAEALKMIPPDRPDLVEPVEVMVEAALALCTGDPRTLTGRVVCSRSLLEELGRTPRTLDGKADFHEEGA